MEMRLADAGWVIINIGHPTTSLKYICPNSFRLTKRACISDFVKGSGNDWSYWRNKYNFRAQRATLTITT
jgi:hypothetical protein